MNEIKSLYMHFPFCKHLCNYCDFYKSVPSSRQEILTHQENLALNFDKVSQFHQENGYGWGELETLFLGGGTPSLWGQEGAVFLKSFFDERNIKLATGGEFTVEFNPGTLSREILDSFKEAGFNRFSIGMQSLNDFFIKTLDRIHTLEDCYNILTLMKDSKENFSIDLMIGLPYSVEKKRDVIEELKRAIEFYPSHFSVYILTIKDSYRHPLPDENYIADEYLKVSEFLNKNGFSHYEVSNFAKDGYQSKHNLKYWNSESVAALGPSATGLLTEKKIRYKCGSDYQRLKLETLSEDEFYLERIYMKMRTHLGIELDDLIDKEKGRSLFERWNNENILAYKDDKKIALNSQGYLIIDSLINQLV